MQRPTNDVTRAPSTGSFLDRLRPDAARIRVLRGLFPFVWPVDRPDLQRTVMLSLGLMLVAKIVTVLMPYTFKWGTDALVAASGGTLPPGGAFWLLGAPGIVVALVFVLERWRKRGRA